MKKKHSLILDTSVFVNPASARFFGESPTTAFVRFLQLVKLAREVECLMPPAVYAELMNFVEEKKVPQNLLLLIHRQPPKKHELKIPAIFIYDLVYELRDRTDRGLRLAEKTAREALQAAPPAPLPAGASSIRPDAEMVSRLRENFRRIMREGMLDSNEDVDLLLLAYQTEGSLVTADQGVLTWAKELGVSVLPYDHLMEFLSSHSGNVAK